MNALFEHPERLFLALAVIPATIVFVLRFRALRKTLLPLVSRMDDVSIRPLGHILRWRTLFFSVSWIFLVCAFAGPRWGSELVTTRQEGSSVIFVLDVSRSMAVGDVPPSRLSFAAGYASMLMGRMDSARCGLVLDKGDAVLAIPLTADHRALDDLLETVSPSMLSSPGSDLSRGIHVALGAFAANTSDSRTVILLTDGDETAGSLDEAARDVRNSGAKLVIVGVGTKTGRKINVKPSAQVPEMRVTVLRDELLRNTARLSGRGSLYVSGIETGSANAVLAAIAPSSDKARKLVYSSKPVYRYEVFLFAAFFFFCAGMLTGGVSWRKK